MPEPTKILFVCVGNIVRSPLAENLFRHLANQAGVDQKYQVDSAGTSAWHIGEPPDRRMRRVAASHGFNYNGRARQVTPQDFDDFDLIIAMDPSNLKSLRALAKKSEHLEKIHLLRSFDPEGDDNAIVPDPYYGGIEDFHEVYRIVEQAAKGLLDSLEAEKVK